MKQFVVVLALVCASSVLGVPEPTKLGEPTHPEPTKLHLQVFFESACSDSMRFVCNEAFRHVETLFIQGNVFIRPGPLMVGGIAPANNGPGRIKTLLWMNKVSTPF